MNNFIWQKKKEKNKQKNKKKMHKCINLSRNKTTAAVSPAEN